MTKRGNEQASNRLVLALNFGGFVVVLVTVWIAWLIIPLFGIELSKLSLFTSTRTLLLFMFSVMALPLGVFGEYWLSRWKKRQFLWKSTLLIIGIFGLFIFVSAFFLTVFNLLFSGLLWFWQMLFVAISNSIGLFIMAMAIRNEKFKKWRQTLGW